MNYRNVAFSSSSIDSRLLPNTCSIGMLELLECVTLDDEKLNARILQPRPSSPHKPIGPFWAEAFPVLRIWTLDSANFL